jgi:hypothetical protein
MTGVKAVGVKPRSSWRKATFWQFDNISRRNHNGSNIINKNHILSLLPNGILPQTFAALLLIDVNEAYLSQELPYLWRDGVYN